MIAVLPARSDVVGGDTVRALVAAEIRRALRSPLLWAGLAGSLAIVWWFDSDGAFTDPGAYGEHYAAWEFPVGPLAFVAFLVANGAALRDRPPPAADLLASTPARGWERTVGLLAGALVPTLMGLAVFGVQDTAVLAHGTAVLGDGPWVSTFEPALLELLGGPLAVACSWVAGIAVARLVRSRTVGAVLGFLGWALFSFDFYTFLYAPFGLFALSRSAVVAADLGSDPSPAQLAAHQAVGRPGDLVPGYLGLDRDLPSYALHLVFVVGVASLLAALALARSGRDRRTRPVGAVGLALVLLGLGGQVLTLDTDLGWLDPL
ncbi:hypothetical protein [Blastococcus sp. URHD0036]|uniref:hypothetical protein n=1 Tax=Blastococcus sp. URHD0036 TaxID=1380356 RepID=UPI000495DEA0|nr:hypothetical protein [Blastococcus sp. URHD0036]